MATLTHMITHSPLFARSRPERSRGDDAALLQHELLYGTAAQDAFVALFNEVDDFEALAHEAARAPLARELPRRRERSRSYDAGVRAGRAQARARDAAGTAPTNHPDLHAPR